MSSTQRTHGKRNRKAAEKNEQMLNLYFRLLNDAETKEEFERVSEREAILICRIIAPKGGGVLEVLYPDGSTDRVPVRGVLKFEGRAASKSGLGNCFSADDIAINCGGQLAAKIPGSEVKDVREEFDRLGIVYPPGFFAPPTSVSNKQQKTTTAVDDEEDIFARGSAPAVSSGGGSGSGAMSGGNDDEEVDVDNI